MQTLAEASLRPAERRTVERLVEVLKAEFGADLYAVWLYGSRARGEELREESDVDLLVLLRRDSRYEDGSRAYRLMFEVADAEGAPGAYFSIHVDDLAWLQRRRTIEDFFIQEVDRDKVVLYGDP